MEQIKAAQGKAMDTVHACASKGKVLANDFKTRSVAAAKDPKVQTTVGSAAAGTVLMGLCGGALGVVAGGTAGAALGLPFVLFTFGLSVPFSAVMGAGVAGSSGMVAGGTAGCATGGTLGYTVFAWRKELQDVSKKVLAKLNHAKDASRAHAVSAFAATRARFVTVRVSVVAQVQNMTTTVKSKVSALTNSGIQVVKDPKAQATAAGATVGGVVLGGAGGVIGLASGVLAGSIVGVVPALFTFGLSIPVFAIVGGGAGLCVGTAVGGTTGTVGGGAAGYGVYGKRAELAEGARTCWSYTTARLEDVKAFVESKTSATKNVPVKSAALDVAKKSRPIGA